MKDNLKAAVASIDASDVVCAIGLALLGYGIAQMVSLPAACIVCGAIVVAIVVFA
jgi:hypothetical protein